MVEAFSTPINQVHSVHQYDINTAGLNADIV